MVGFYPSLISALVGCELSTPRYDRCNPQEREPAPSVQEARRAPGPAWRGVDCLHLLSKATGLLSNDVLFWNMCPNSRLSNAVSFNVRFHCILNKGEKLSYLLTGWGRRVIC